jgi:hypothetical protein
MDSLARQHIKDTSRTNNNTRNIWLWNDFQRNKRLSKINLRVSKFKATEEIGEEATAKLRRLYRKKQCKYNTHLDQ